jgi:hypothetical protein
MSRRAATGGPSTRPRLASGPATRPGGPPRRRWIRRPARRAAACGPGRRRRPRTVAGLAADLARSIRDSRRPRRRSSRPQPGASGSGRARPLVVRRARRRGRRRRHGAAVAVELVHRARSCTTTSSTAATSPWPSERARAGSPREHPEPGGHAEEHGRSVAVLLGDVLLAAAGAGLHGVPRRPDALRARTRRSPPAGRGDGRAVPRRGRRGARSADRDRALRIATLKSGRYSVARPLELGALLAGAARRARGGCSRSVTRSGSRSSCGTTCSASSVTRPPRASRRAPTSSRASARCSSRRRSHGSTGRAAGFDAALGDPSLDADGGRGAAATDRSSGARTAVEARIAGRHGGRGGARGAPHRRDAPAELRQLADWMTLRHH